MLLKQEDKNIILSIAKQFLDPLLEIWAYGSRVNGQAHEASDLDLVIVTDHPWQEVALFKKALQESNLAFLVDVQPWKDLPENFQKNILQKYEIL